jgi:twitching motility protein PilT
MVTLRELLELMAKKNASDLHLTVGSPPQLRIDGKLIKTDVDTLAPEETKKLAYSIMSEKQKQTFEEKSELDLSFGIENLSRFRCNVFMQRGNVAVALRQIPFRIPGFEELGIPKVVSELADLPRGLILITGPTGSGKSTTLAALINKINLEIYCHILTVEDPIEYLHRHNCSLINQREVYADTTSFGSALKYALREDPDVVLVGEMRDLETMEATLNISETGHLAFATLHTNSCAESINRIIDVFPTNQQEQVRVTVSFVLQAVVSQQLIPKIGGGGQDVGSGDHDLHARHQSLDPGRQDSSDLQSHAGRPEIRDEDHESILGRALYETQNYSWRRHGEKLKHPGAE